MSLSCLKSFSGCPLSASCSLTRPLTVWPCRGRCFRRFWIWNVQTPHLKILKMCLYGHFVFSFVKKFPQVIKVPGPIKSNSTLWALPCLQPHFMSVSLSLSAFARTWREAGWDLNSSCSWSPVSSPTKSAIMRHRRRLQSSQHPKPSQTREKGR